MRSSPRSMSLLALARHVRRRGAPEERTHPASKLADRERLRDVVVGAELETEHLVELLAARCQHDDRDVALAAQTLADLEPVEPRQHDVEDDEVERVLVEAPERLFAVARLDDRVPVPLERVREQGLNRFLVVDEEDGRRELGIGAFAQARGRRRAYYSPAMDAARPRTRGRRLRHGTVERPLNGRLVRVGFLVVIPAFLAFLFSISTTGALPRSQLDPLFDGASAATFAETLTTQYPSRVPGSEGAAESAIWYRETVASLGLQTEEDVWTADLAGLGEVELRNIVSVVPGRSDQTIVVVAHRDNAGAEEPLGENAAGNGAAHRARSRLCRPGGRAGPTAGAHARPRLDRRRRVRRGGRRTLRRRVATCGRRARSRRPRRPRPTAARSLAIAGDEPVSPARTLVRTAAARVHGGGRRRALAAVAAGTARGPRRAVRAGRAGPLPRGRPVGGHRDHGR